MDIPRENVFIFSGRPRARGRPWSPAIPARGTGAKSRPRAGLLAIVVVFCLGGPWSGVASAQGPATFFYGGGTRTWSTGTNWWKNYAGTVAAGGVPGSQDTAVFNTSGGNGSGTAVFTGDASVNGLLLLSSATGNLTLQSGTTGNRTLTLGAGGIRTLATSGTGVVIGSSVANAGLNVTLNASQQWFLRSGTLWALNNIAGSAGSNAAQTLLIKTSNNARTVLSGTVSDGGSGGKLNLWIDGAMTSWSQPSTLTGTLTFQNTPQYTSNNQGLQNSGTFAVSALQFAGGGLNSGTYTLSQSGAVVRFLGGASMVGYQAVFELQSGTFARSVGGGFASFSHANTYAARGVMNDINVNGLIPWSGQNGTSGRALKQWNANGTLTDFGSWSTPTSWSSCGSSAALRWWGTRSRSIFNQARSPAVSAAALHLSAR